ncbi:hypothetical protein D918_02625 [Trichuris suis]|nr:hypothetical protein D918_02625 [Trichuris suis]
MANVPINQLFQSVAFSAKVSNKTIGARSLRCLWEQISNANKPYLRCSTFQTLPSSLRNPRCK